MIVELNDIKIHTEGMITLIKTEEFIIIINKLESKYGSLINVPEDDQDLLKLRSLISTKKNPAKINVEDYLDVEDYLKGRLKSLSKNDSLSLLYKKLNRDSLIKNYPIKFSLLLSDYKVTTENLFRRGYSKRAILYQMTSKVGADFIESVDKRFKEGLKNGKDKYLCIPDDIVQLDYNIRKSKIKTVTYYSSSMSREKEWVRLSVRILQKYLEDDLYSSILLN